MLQPRYSRQFKKDYKLAMKRGKNMEKLKQVMSLLIAEQPLPAHCRPHVLSGTLKGVIDVHVESDWLLLYLPGDGTICFERTGSHSDLFGA